MKNGEVARVLVFEHVNSISLEGLIESFQEHSDTDEPRINLPFCDIMLGQAKAVVCIMSFQILYPHKNTVLQTKLALNGISEINKRGILHGDISVQNMLITPTADNPTQVVFIDFVRCNSNLTERKLKELGHDEPKNVMTFLTLCCTDYYEDLVEWAEVRGSLGSDLIYPRVSI